MNKYILINLILLSALFISTKTHAQTDAEMRMQERQQELENRKIQRQETIENRIETRQQNIEDRAEQRQERVENRKAVVCDNIKNRVDNIINRYNNAIKLNETHNARIKELSQERVNDLKAKGADTAELEQYLSEFYDIQENAKASYNEAISKLENVKSLDCTGDNETARTLIEEARELIRESRNTNVIARNTFRTTVFNEIKKLYSELK